MLYPNLGTKPAVHSAFPPPESAFAERSEYIPRLTLLPMRITQPQDCGAVPIGHQQIAEHAHRPMCANVTRCHAIGLCITVADSPTVMAVLMPEDRA